MKHTKGIWIVNEKYKTITDSQGYGIAQENGIHNSQEWEANAKLIASAPELLESLITLLSDAKQCAAMYGNEWRNDPDLVRADKAIKKATE